MAISNLLFDNRYEERGNVQVGIGSQRVHNPAANECLSVLTLPCLRKHRIRFLQYSKNLIVLAMLVQWHLLLASMW